jgi:hypothetical protein
MFRCTDHVALDDKYQSVVFDCTTAFAFCGKLTPREHWYDVAKGQKPKDSENSGSDTISSLGEAVE